jgi:hypothetical protein
VFPTLSLELNCLEIHDEIGEQGEQEKGYTCPPLHLQSQHRRMPPPHLIPTRAPLSAMLCASPHHYSNSSSVHLHVLVCVYYSADDQLDVFPFFF